MEEIVEVIIAGIMFIGLVGVLIDRIVFKKGINTRVIQLLALIFIIPTILILSIEDFFEPEQVGILLAAIIGFVLSGTGKDETDLKR